MNCDHDADICWLSFDPDPSFGEFIRRLVHVFGPEIIDELLSLEG